MLFYRKCYSALVIAAISLCQLACTREAPVASTPVTDDFGDTLVVGGAPMRIVSLNPTTTELVYAIGAGARLVGRTSYDAIPAEVRSVPDLGPGLRPNIEAVLAVHPDLILLYASADNRAAAQRFRSSGIATASYKIDRIADMIRVTRLLGRLTGDTAAASRTVDSVTATIKRVRALTANLPHPTVFWPLWDAPLLSVGGGSWLNELIEIAGARNVFAELPQPSPTVAFEELLKRDPDFILGGTTTRRRAATDQRWQALRAVRQNHVLVIDSTIANGPSARVGASAESIARLLHPDVKF